MTLFELQRNLETFDLLETVAESVADTKDLIVFFNRMQLLRGLDSEGNYLSPRYSQDPYFKTPESAKRYADWKARIEPHTDKPADVPNLYISGKFHGSIDISVEPTYYNISSNDSNAPDIERDFGETIYGLNIESRNEYITSYLLETVQGKVTSRLGLKFS